MINSAAHTRQPSRHVAEDRPTAWCFISLSPVIRHGFSSRRALSWNLRRPFGVGVSFKFAEPIHQPHDDFTDRHHSYVVTHPRTFQFATLRPVPASLPVASLKAEPSALCVRRNEHGANRWTETDTGASNIDTSQ